MERQARGGRGNAAAAPSVAVPRGPVWVAQLFLLSLLIPFYLPVGSLLLMPHRIVLLLAFIPFFMMLFVMRRSGPVLKTDWLMFGSAFWAGPAMLANHPFAEAIEPLGIHMVEFFGAYLLARVSIRNAEDFRRVVRLFFFLMLFLLPFAAVESITRQPILLDLLPNTSVRPVDAGVRLGMRRAQTIFAHPILFGVFVSTGLGLFWYVLRPRWLRFPAILVTAAATVFSLSTGALFSFMVQAIFISWEAVMKTLRRRWALIAWLAAAGYIVVDLIATRSPFHVVVNYATFSSGSAYNRIRIWNFGTDSVWNNPIFGLGLNDWERPSWMGPSVDNFWLLIAMRYGLPAIVMLLVALFIMVWRISQVDLPDPEDQLARAGYLTAIGGIFIAGGTVHYWHAMMAFVLFIIGSGLWTIAGGASGKKDGDAAEDTSARPVSPYTRQTGLGQSIPEAGRGGPARASSVNRSSPRAFRPPRRKAGPAGRL